MAVETLLAQIEVNLPLESVSFFTSRSDLIYLRLKGDLLKIELGALRQTDRQTRAEAAAATALSFVSRSLSAQSVPHLTHSCHTQLKTRTFPRLAVREKALPSSSFPLRRMINMFAKRTQEVSKQSD